MIDVSSIAAIVGIDTTVYSVANLTLVGREGIFDFRVGKLSTYVTADTANIIWVAPGIDLTGASGAWVRRRENLDVSATWAGAQPNTTNDSQPAIMACYNLLAATSLTTEGIIGRILALGGKYRIAAAIAFSLPVAFFCPNFLEFTPTASSAVIIGAAAPTAWRNTGYDINIGGLRAVNGNLATPTGINATGCSGIEVRNCQFSTIKVGRIIAFTKYGFWGNSSNDTYTGQQVQDNNIWLGDVAYCGAGFLAESHGPADGAFQVNEIHIQNSFGNWNNVILGKNGDGNTNDNTLFLNGADADTGGGNISVGSSYNTIYAGYINGTVTFQASAFDNWGYHGAGVAQCTVFDNNGTNHFRHNVEGTILQERWWTAGLAALQLIQSTDSGATVAELVDLYRNSASPAANDEGVAIDFSFNNASLAKFVGCYVNSSLVSPTVGSEYARLRFFNRLCGVKTNVANLYQGWAVGATAADMGIGTVNVSGDYYVNGSPLNPAPVTKAANFTVAMTENLIICSAAAVLTGVLPAPASCPGRKIWVKTTAQAVVSASANVVPLAGGPAGTAILAAVAGKWADLHSDGANWVIMAGN